MMMVLQFFIVLFYFPGTKTVLPRRIAAQTQNHLALRLNWDRSREAMVHCDFDIYWSFIDKIKELALS
jgi:hypothetical protein